jgi:hypothetical protein
MHRQEIDDVRPILAVLIPVPHQLRCDRVAVGVVADKDGPEVLSR